MQQQPAVLLLLGGTTAHDDETARDARFVAIVRAIDVIRNRGLLVTLATRDGATLRSVGASPLATQSLRSVAESSFDALLVLDGLGTCDDLRDDLAFARIVRHFDATPRPLALTGSAIEAATAVRRCDGTPILRDRRVAATMETAERLRAAGAEPLVEPTDAEHVSVDAYLITAQTARSLDVTAHLVVAYLASPLRRRAMRAS